MKPYNFKVFNTFQFQNPIQKNQKFIFRIPQVLHKNGLHILPVSFYFHYRIQTISLIYKFYLTMMVTYESVFLTIYKHAIWKSVITILYHFNAV